ncbi:MAG TPA: efflux RND transporter periplasmic adaptor subunit [Cyclobacteriaceae bacterium]|nr:efflux RND transporter periplasmic adaptor subunit [Cyclobacteriaceae bacterium]
MKTPTKIILIGSIICVIALIFFYPRLDLWNSEGSMQGAQQPAQPDRLAVEVVQVEPQRLENNLSVTGNIIPNETVALRSEISGLVTEINFEEGQFVKKGTPLVYLNDDELTAQRARLEYTKKLYEGQENRQKQLLEREAISQEEYDIVLNQFNTNLADINLIEAMIRQTVIRAPFDGVLGLRRISEGAVITPNDVIVDVVNIDPIKIDFSIPERYANVIQQGATISFTNDAIEGEASGKVYAIAPNIDPATRTVQLRAISPNKDRKFLPGMFVAVKVNLNVVEDAIMIPSQALIPELEGYKVFVVDSENKIDEAKVSIGRRTEREVQITEGLREGDLVLTTGVIQAKQDMQVEITKTH